MRPIDIRNDCFADLQERLTGEREKCWLALLTKAPMTTDALANSMQKGVLMVRPRITELVQLGFVELVSRKKHEGIYRALPIGQAHQRFDELKHQIDQQLDLGIKEQ